MTLTANLLLTVVKKNVHRKWAFSSLVTAVRQMLMYYVDLFLFLEAPEQAWEAINARRYRPPTDGQLSMGFASE